MQENEVGATLQPEKTTSRALNSPCPPFPSGVRCDRTVPSASFENLGSRRAFTMDPHTTPKGKNQEPEPPNSLTPPKRVSFELGQIVITPGARAILSNQEIASSLARHCKGDWGMVSKDDSKENDLSVKEGFRILSSYQSQSGEKFWIITEADRSSTCLLLPSEY